MPSPSQALRSLFWLGYQVVFALLSLLASPFLWMKKGGPKRDGLRHYLVTLPGRTTWDLPEMPARCRASVWLHAVSVGEAMVATTLVHALLKTLPDDVAVVLTTVTPTGQRQVKNGLKRQIAGRVVVAYLPFDLRPLLARFHRRFRPAVLVLVEGDFWPLALSDAKRRGLAVAVVNGRSSDRAFGRQRRLGRVNDFLYRHVDLFGVQTEDDARRFVALGVDPVKLHVTGNLKFDAPPPEEKPELERAIRDLAGDRPILVAGSTMAGHSPSSPGEDEMVLDAFEIVRTTHDAVLVLAPRHPERFGAVAELLSRRGLPFVRRSESASPSAGSAPVVVLLDTMGELSRVYCLARAAFIGGTLVPTGGHNPLEPAQFAVPTVVGPGMHNFREMALIFDRERAWSRVDDVAGLARQWTAWLDDAAAATAVGQQARRLLEEGAGAVERSLVLIEPLLARVLLGEPS